MPDTPLLHTLQANRHLEGLILFGSSVPFLQGIVSIYTLLQDRGNILWTLGHRNSSERG